MKKSFITFSTIFLLLLSLVFLISKYENEYKEYSAEKRGTYKIFFLYDNGMPQEDFFRMTDLPSKYGKLIGGISYTHKKKLTTPQKKLIKELEIKEFPTYVIFDHNRPVLQTHNIKDIETFLNDKKSNER